MPTSKLDALAAKAVPYLLAIIIAGGGYYLAQIDLRIKSLEDKYVSTERSAGRVEDLLMKSPNLEREVHEMHAILSSTLPDIQKTGNDTHDRVIKLEERMQDQKDQLSNMQYQIHQIPSMHNK